VKPWPIALLVVAACKGHGTSSAPSCAEAPLEAPFAQVAPVIDGKLDEPAWLVPSASRPFVDAERPEAIIPHTEVRALWDAQNLYVAFYAADEDIRSTDYVGLVIGPSRWEIAPSGALRCAREVDCSGVRAQADTDGKIDQPDPEAEEWTAELVIPWRVLGRDAAPAELQVNFVRRDQPKGSPVRQLVWTHACPLGTLRLARPPNK
jgi:hypothetical protein